MLRSDATEFRYEREQQPMRRLGAWTEELDRLLAANEVRPNRSRLTLIRLFEALRAVGYEGGSDAVRRYAATWRREQVSATAAAYVPLSFEPGEAYQLDWSYEIVLIGGTTVTISVPIVLTTSVQLTRWKKEVRLLIKGSTGETKPNPSLIRLVVKANAFWAALLRDNLTMTELAARRG